MSEEFIGNNILTGSIKDMETGEETNMCHYMFITGFEFTTIGMVENVEAYTHPDNSFQICVDCKALDSIGFVFDLALDFTPETVAEKDKILQDMNLKSVYIFKGKYNVAVKEDPHHIMLHSPDYQPVSPQFSEEEIREAFRVNGDMY